MDIKSAGYLQGNLEHHLDHLAPFCSLMRWPLIVTDDGMFAMACRYYPDLQVILWNPIEAPFKVTKRFDFIVTTLPRPAFDELFFIAEKSLQKRTKTLWLPHGNSDKGHLTLNMEALRFEETILVYGPKMVDVLNQTKALKTVKNVIQIGNFRYTYFQKYRYFYTQLLRKMGLNNPFVLYAPTWNDAERSSSFETAIDTIICEMSQLSLVIKPHPNTSQDVRALQKKLCYSSKVIWLDYFPPIYPLLERASHLIGDFSSIGYDFLYFNRPMVFFNASGRPHEDQGRFLHQYGETITLSDLPFLSSKFRNHSYQEQLQPIRQKLYRYTFGDEQPWMLISQQLLALLEKL